MGTARLVKNVAPGIHRLDHAHVNCYLVEDGGDLTIVDTAFPKTWPLLIQAIDAIGRRPTDVRAILLTHGHFDHMGFARRAQQELDVPVWAHTREGFLAAHPYSYSHERSRLLYPMLYPATLGPMLSMVKAGALWVQGATGLQYFEDGQVLEVPGLPKVVFTPGHTYGHAALHFPDRSAVITGDALVTLDPYTGATGPQIVSGAATADSEQAFASLEALAATDADRVLPGHGEHWRDGIRSAVVEALKAGPS